MWGLYTPESILQPAKWRWRHKTKHQQNNKKKMFKRVATVWTWSFYLTIIIPRTPWSHTWKLKGIYVVSGWCNWNHGVCVSAEKSKCKTCEQHKTKNINYGLTYETRGWDEDQGYNLLSNFPLLFIVLFHFDLFSIHLVPNNWVGLHIHSLIFILLLIISMPGFKLSTSPYHFHPCPREPVSTPLFIVIKIPSIPLGGHLGGNFAHAQPAKPS